MAHAIRKENNCLNCGHIVEGRYCTHCGQENIEPRERFSELAGHFAADLLHFDTQFFSTIRYLLFKPGYLTQEYIKGRRKAYLHPIRMYLFVSVLYFFLASVIPLHRASHFIGEINASSKSLPKEKGLVSYSSIRQYDSAQQQLPAEERDPRMVQLLVHRLIELQQKYGKHTAEVLREKYVHHFPQVMFFLLPMFALLLELHYSRKKFYFSDHVIFSLHFHIFYFFLSTIELILQYLLHEDYFSILGLLVWLYLILALRRVYQNGWMKTIFKSLSILFLYTICIGVVTGIMFIWVIEAG